MVNIVTPEHNPFVFDENEEYEWNDEMLNNVGILELDMDIDWNTTFDDNPDLEPVTMDMDMDNNATWDDYIPGLLFWSVRMPWNLWCWTTTNPLYQLHILNVITTLPHNVIQLIC